MTAEDTVMWERALAGVRADALDCLQANLAVLADGAHGPGAHLRWGARVEVRMRETGDLPTVVPDQESRLAEAAELIGLRVRERHQADRLPSSIGPDPLYVLADGYQLPWVPYFRRRHVGHSFLAVGTRGGRHTVLDAYHIDTPHGSARPGRWEIDADVLAGCADAWIWFDPAPPAALEPALAVPEEPVVDRYVSAYRRFPDRAAALDRLALETWSLARTWLLHAYWDGGQSAREHADEWGRVAQQIYLAHRRVAGGRAEPSEWPDRLALMLLSRPASADRAGVRTTVVEVVTDVLGVPPPRDGSLAAMPGFNSFRMVEIVERIERRLGVEIPAAELVPENLTRLDGIATVARRALEGTRSQETVPLYREE